MNRRDFFKWAGRLFAALPFVALADLEPDFQTGSVVPIDSPNYIWVQFSPWDNIYKHYWYGPDKPLGVRYLYTEYSPERVEPGFYYPYPRIDDWSIHANQDMALDATFLHDDIFGKAARTISKTTAKKLEETGAIVLKGFIKNK